MKKELDTIVNTGNGQYKVNRQSLAYWLKTSAQKAAMMGLRPGQITDIPLGDQPINTSMEMLSTSIVIISEGEPVKK